MCSDHQSCGQTLSPYIYIYGNKVLSLHPYPPGARLLPPVLASYLSDLSLFLHPCVQLCIMHVSPHRCSMRMHCKGSIPTAIILAMPAGTMTLKRPIAVACTSTVSLNLRTFDCSWTIQPYASRAQMEQV